MSATVKDRLRPLLVENKRDVWNVLTTARQISGYDLAVSKE
jgi:hypothetical protein